MDLTSPPPSRRPPWIALDSHRRRGRCAIVVYRSVTFMSQPPPRRGAVPGWRQSTGRGGAHRPRRYSPDAARARRGDAARDGYRDHADQRLFDERRLQGRPARSRRGNCWRRSIRAPTKSRSSRIRRSSPATRRRSSRRRWISPATRRCRGQQSIARQTYEDQVWTVKQDQGTVDYDKAQIKAQQLNLTYCRIVAPTDGRVGLRQVDPGNYVQTGLDHRHRGAHRAQAHDRGVRRARGQCPAGDGARARGRSLPVTAFDRANVTQLATGQLAAVDTPGQQHHRHGDAAGQFRQCR